MHAIHCQEWTVFSRLNDCYAIFLLITSSPEEIQRDSTHCPCLCPRYGVCFFESFVIDRKTNAIVSTASETKTNFKMCLMHL